MRKPLLRALAVGLLILLAVGGYYLWFHVLLCNFQVVIPGKVYRSGQPSPGQLARWVREYGLKTVLDLRGSETSAVVAERAVAGRLNVKLICVAVGAHSAMPRPVLIQLTDILESCDKPMLIHCYGGVERSGTVSALAVMAVGNESFDSARREAYAPLALWRKITKGDYVSDVFPVYAKYCARAGLARDGWRQFKTWATGVYWPRYFHVSIAAPREVALAPGESTDVPVTITNISDETLPAADSAKAMQLGAYTGGPTYDSTASVFVDSSAPLPAHNVPIGGSFTLTKRITAPRTPGDYPVFLDIFEAPNVTFGAEGSEPALCVLHVAESPRPSGSQIPPPQPSSNMLAAAQSGAR